MGSGVPSIILDLLPWSDDKSKITTALAVAMHDDGRVPTNRTAISGVATAQRTGGVATARQSMDTDH